MALITISEASRLTGKTRATIHRNIKQGKLSKIIDDTGSPKIDTSELLRVYGSLNDTDDTCKKNSIIKQGVTGTKNTDDTVRIALLEKEVEHLNRVIHEKENTIEVYKKSLELLELKVLEPVSPPVSQDDTPKQIDTPKKRWWQIFK